MASEHVHEKVPLSNCRATIFGTAISFQIVATFAVILRLYVRFKIRKLGWDDAFIVIAKICATFTGLFVCLSVKWGLGQHLDTLSDAEIGHYLFHFYFANATYITSTSLVKISLLLQYLRMYHEGMMRRVCIALMVLISIWGATYGFMAWFPCFPVNAYWNWTIVHHSCYAFGGREQEPLVATYVSHASLNMLLDIAVLLAALPSCFKRALTRREYLGIIGLFSIGVLVIAISIWRLISLVNHQVGWQPTLDFTWYTAISIILSYLEIDIALWAASMPVFWPMIETSLMAIFVTKEVHIERHVWLGGNEFEVDGVSMRSTADSKTALNRSSRKGASAHEMEAYVVENLTPTEPEERIDDRVARQSKSGTVHSWLDMS